MKLKVLLIVISCLLMAGPVAADDDVMITRDGSMMTVKVEKISKSQVTFIDLKHILAAPNIPMQQALASTMPTPATTVAPSTTSHAATNQQLLASETAELKFAPALEMNAAELEMKINAINPYTLYRKGAVAEYCFQYKGKQTQLEGGPTYIQQIISDERIENGLLVAYIRQEYFNKKHEPSKGLPASFKGYLYPVEIDTAGVYHLTHNLLYDIFLINKRQGYGVLIPGNMKPGMQLNNSTLHDNIKHPLFGGNFGVETVYSNWQVVKEEKITTPVGTFDCVKIVGNIEQKKGKGSFSAKQKVICWMARGIGMVQYETAYDS